MPLVTAKRLLAAIKRHIFPNDDGNNNKTRAQTISYTVLPPEIRNRIMYFALVSPEGIVPPPGLNLAEDPTYIPISRSRRILSSMQITSRYRNYKLYFEEEPVPGLMFLVASKQIYREGLAMFFSQNTFYIPYGHYDYSTCYFDELDDAPATLIRHFALRYSIHDLTPEILEQAEWEALRRYHHPDNPSPLRDLPISPNRWAQQVDLVLNCSYWAKLKYIRNWLLQDMNHRQQNTYAQQFGDLGSMTTRLEFPDGAVIEFSMDGNWARHRLRWSEETKDVRMCDLWAVCKDVQQECRDLMLFYVDRMVGRLGWQGFKEVQRKVGEGKIVKERDYVVTI